MASLGVSENRFRGEYGSNLFPSSIFDRFAILGIQYSLIGNT